jgi:hypothetical protein
VKKQQQQQQHLIDKQIPVYQQAKFSDTTGPYQG